jgi:hypothetical protein
VLRLSASMNFLTSCIALSVIVSCIVSVLLVQCPPCAGARAADAEVNED